MYSKNNHVVEEDTIVAIATPKGVGGVGIIRISGYLVPEIMHNMLKNISNMLPNKAIYTNFFNIDKEIIDKGIAIFFKAPNSFTGEDVLELHGHGGPVILNMLLKAVIFLGARIAEPGEFSKRAFLSNKIDLVQAESVVALINSQTEQAAKAAIKSLQGEFSKRINLLIENLIKLRAHVEALIDFPEEDVDPLTRSNVQEAVNLLIEQISFIVQQSKHGVLLNDGIKAVILGKPNVGKSSLLNYLSQEELAIVTEIPGTTRDLVSNKVNIGGVVIDFVDTAGVRVTDDIIEQIGVKKTIKSLEVADLILLMLDIENFLKIQEPLNLSKFLPDIIQQKLLIDKKILILVNKIDLFFVNNHDCRSRSFDHLQLSDNIEILFISIKQDFGMQKLINKIKNIIGISEGWEHSTFFAKLRHMEALKEALNSLSYAKELLINNHNNWDWFAEELKNSQNKLSKITGAFTNEDLLDRIFSEFCIGK